mmetsp:Transcript_15763/g.19220  ORF Transcript_15763/g.19220 Transcript_15763/m.19220 type:complete len:221 (+) Transcript_15763:165-827(+)
MYHQASKRRKQPFGRHPTSETGQQLLMMEHKQSCIDFRNHQIHNENQKMTASDSFEEDNDTQMVCEKESLNENCKNKRAHDTSLYSSYNDEIHSSSEYERQKIHHQIRYNNKKTNYSLYPRVQYYRYPDPSKYGWTFTGSCDDEKVEFYEQEIYDEAHGSNMFIYLDFYYTNGTVKTVLNHPSNGLVQLFGKGRSLLPDVYIKILQCPKFSDSGFRRRQS